jgi:hypothetical protein
MTTIMVGFQAQSRSCSAGHDGEDVDYAHRSLTRPGRHSPQSGMRSIRAVLRQSHVYPHRRVFPCHVQHTGLFTVFLERYRELLDGSGQPRHLVRLKISAVSTPLKWLRLAVYWIARFRHDLQPEEQL